MSDRTIEVLNLKAATAEKKRSPITSFCKYAKEKNAGPRCSYAPFGQPDSAVPRSGGWAGQAKAATISELSESRGY